jgi:hypothetical protein
MCLFEVQCFSVTEVARSLLELVQGFERNRNFAASVATQRREIRENTPVLLSLPERKVARSTAPGGSLRFTVVAALKCM